MFAGPILTLQDASARAPTLAESLKGTSLDYFEPRCVHTYWEVERKPLENQTLVLRPNQPVSRAWDSVFRWTFGQALHQQFGRFGHFPHRLPPQVPKAGPPVPLSIEFAEDSHERDKFIWVVNAATETANALVPEAEAICRQAHGALAREMGLDRPRVGF